MIRPDTATFRRRRVVALFAAAIASAAAIAAALAIVAASGTHGDEDTAARPGIAVTTAAEASVAPIAARSPADPSRLCLGLPTPLPGPRTIALGSIEVLRDDPVVFAYRVASSQTPTARVTIVVRRRDGTAVARLTPASPQPCGRKLTCTLPQRLPPGEYRYTVYAVDEDGRQQRAAGSRPLVVRAAVPSPEDVARAVAWLSRRSGYVGFAVIDSEGRLLGWHEDQQFVTASVVKAMLFVAYLRSHPDGPGSMSSTLRTMIDVSDNGAASAVHGVVGDAGMYAVARAAGMKRFAGCGYWSGAMITAADQARFFARLFDLVPPGERAYARGVMSGIASYQSWGIPAATRHHGWTVFFKGGWRGTDRGQLVHQVARLEKDGQVVTIAVLTDGDPSMAYGIETIRGAAERALDLH